MSHSVPIMNVHGVEEFYVDFVPAAERVDKPGEPARTALRRTRSNVPVLASTVQKTKQWIGELMTELQWQEGQKAYHGMRAVLHALRDRLTLQEAADLSAQLPMLIRGMYYEGWQPDRIPVKDRTKEAFLTHIFREFPDDPGVDPELLTRAVLRVMARHVSPGEIEDMKAVVPAPLRELFPG